MKIAIVTDVHFGCRNDSRTFLDSCGRFFDDIFFPYIDEHEITTVINLGDLVDRRRFINFNTASMVNEKYIIPMHQRGLDHYLVAGNHDCFFKTTNQLNALRNLYDDTIYLANTKIIDETPAEYDFDGLKVLFVPWICEDNYDATHTAINETKAQICMGHLELQGFEMFKGHMSQHGLTKKTFEKFDMTLSGHYHHKSSDGGIFYLGCPFEMTWSDYDDPKGFHVFDTETRTLEFIENPDQMFFKLTYDDRQLTMDDLAKIDFSPLTGRYVKVIIMNNDNPYLHDAFMGVIDAVGPIDVQTVEDHLSLNLTTDEEVVSEVEDTKTVLIKTVKNLNIQNEVGLTSYLLGLYTESISLE